MIAKTSRGDRALFALTDDGSLVPSASTHGGMFTHSGTRVTASDAAGLPAALRAIRLLAEGVAQLPLDVVRENKTTGILEPALKAPQRAIFKNPKMGMPTFNFYAFILVCLLTRGNWTARKIKTSPGRIDNLEPFHPDAVRIEIKDGEALYHVREPNGKRITLTRADVLHVPGIELEHPMIGVSPIEAARQAFGTQLARQEWGGSFYRNDATPPVVIDWGVKQPTEDQRRQVSDTWDNRHGKGRAHKVGQIWGGMKLQELSLTPRDSQYIEAEKFGVQEVARIFGVPTKYLDALEVRAPTTEQDRLDFLTFSYAPWLKRVEDAFHADDDLFPSKNTQPRFSTREFLRADSQTRSNVAHNQRQAGIRTANEIRAEDGYPPLPGGDELQTTPVGGAPNAPADPSQEAPPVAATDGHTG